MKKIGILTFYKNNINYGGMLQAYALQRVIESLGYDAEQIDYDYKAMVKNTIWIEIFKYHSKRACVKLLCSMFFYKRERIFSRFEKEIPHSKQTYNCTSIKKTISVYDAFVCGGDQIWNYWEGLGEDTLLDYVLDFVPEEKGKISYSASLGRENVTTEHLEILKKIKRLDCVSVREYAGKEILGRFLENNIQVVADPVLLLAKEDWSSFASDVRRRKKRYVICYFLAVEREQYECALKYACEHKCEMIYFPFMNGSVNVDELLFWQGKKVFNAGPREFVSLIENAECVFTDSYHAVVFSIIFNKQFFVFGRNENVDGENMNSRIDYLLNTYNLKNRFLISDGYDGIDEIDYSDVNESVKCERDMSVDWISNSLEKSLLKSK